MFWRRSCESYRDILIDRIGVNASLCAALTPIWRITLNRWAGFFSPRTWVNFLVRTIERTSMIKLTHFPFPSDPSFYGRYSDKFLYLPERTVWCNQNEDHALAFGPMYFSNKNDRSTKGSTFENLYGKTFHLFFLKDKAIYYVGIYKALDIRSITPNGVPIRDFNGFVVRCRRILLK